MLAVETWALLGITSVTGIIYMVRQLFYRKRRVDEPPIVKGNPLMGSSVEFNTHAVDFLHKAREEYGNVFTIRLINQHLTIIMDPHSFEAMNREKNFDFEAIQRQVNMNVFNFTLKEPRKMIKETGKTVKGASLLREIGNYTELLTETFEQLDKEKQSAGSEWGSGLREFTATTLFDPIFTCIFGQEEEKYNLFNWRDVCKNFDIFHQYFNFMWLGFPKALFPSVGKALGALMEQPSSEELLNRNDCSQYIKTALKNMLAQGQSEGAIKGHNLVYLHVNYNTFRLAFWVLNNIIEDKKAYAALTAEIDGIVKSNLDEQSNTAYLTMADIEGLSVLDSIMNESLRLASGVFMVRYVTEDTWFKTTIDDKEHLIRAGDRIAIYPPATHKDPEIFEDPLTFKFDRFVNATFYKDGEQVKHPIQTFGAICPGKRYALAQLRWYIMSVFVRYNLAFPEGHTTAEYDYQYHGHEILPPINDIDCLCTPRANAPQLVFDRSL